ncbi:MAG TPA: LysR substrate-binding domain-containing protein [Burkholderiales bacterium]|nr:LysR substrate-binding domain-containing protein [Burkholderiales bacterium]
MKLSVDGLLIIDAISRRGSFAAAAEELSRVPSTISYAVQKLEEDLGVRIFDRSGKRARLTEAGEELLREGRLILQALAHLEDRARGLAQGCEATLRISLDALLPCEPLLELAVYFYREFDSTDLRFTHEVLGGSWDALATQRADLVVGASGEGPGDSGYQTRLIGKIEFAAVVAPDHPLARHPSPIASDVWRQYRAVAIGDTSQRLEPRTVGLLLGQKTLTVPHLQAKLSAQLKGLGVGYFPRCFVASHIAAGSLVEVQLENPRSPEHFYLAWDGRSKGKALAWWIEQLDKPDLIARWAGHPL